MNYFNESFSQETEMKKSYDKTKMGTDATLAEGTGYCNMMNAMPGCVQNPIYECPQERVCHRYICHEVLLANGCRLAEPGEFMNVLKKECVIDIFVMKYLTLCLVTQE